MSLLEIVAVIVSALAIWLTARRHMLCWPVGLVSVALYGKIFLDTRLYADMMLQGFFAATILYGWLAWRRGARASGAVRVAAPSPRELWAGLAAGAAGGAALGFALARWTDAALPWLDATLTSYSLVAQVWTARRYLANWWLWIAVDAVYVGMFVFKALYLTAGLYAAFCGLAVIGLRSWRQARRLPAEAAA